MQYTLRKIPKALDAALRRRAKRDGKTLNQVALEAMTEGVGLQANVSTRRRSVQDIVGALPPDPELDAALAEQRSIDPELWR